MLRKQTPHGAIGTVVPRHDPLRPGTLRGVLALAKVDLDDFYKHF